MSRRMFAPQLLIAWVQKRVLGWGIFVTLSERKDKGLEVRQRCRVPLEEMQKCESEGLTKEGAQELETRVRWRTCGF